MKVDPSINIPNQSSQGAEWLQWYINLKNYAGKNQANTLFLKAWHKQGSSNANTSELRSYLSKNGIDIDKGVFSSLYDIGANGIDKIENMLSIGKYAVYAIGGILILGLGYTLYNVARKPELIGTAAKAAMI